MWWLDCFQDAQILNHQLQIHCMALRLCSTVTLLVHPIVRITSSMLSLYVTKKQKLKINILWNQRKWNFINREPYVYIIGWLRLQCYLFSTKEHGNLHYLQLYVESLSTWTKYIELRKVMLIYRHQWPWQYTTTTTIW